jgi:hypothetical protein
MITYTFSCPVCGRVEDVLSTLSAYTSPQFVPPACHDRNMERCFTAPDPWRALDYLTSDAIYDGLKAPDGTDISTRAKHREYMRRNNLTTMDDFTETWKQAARERERSMAGEDPSRVHDVVRAIHKLGG